MPEPLPPARTDASTPCRYRVGSVIKLRVVVATIIKGLPVGACVVSALTWPADGGHRAQLLHGNQMLTRK